MTLTNLIIWRACNAKDFLRITIEWKSIWKIKPLLLITCQQFYFHRFSSNILMSKNLSKVSNKSLISQILLLTFSDSESSVNENEHTQPFKAVAGQKKTWFFVQWVKRSLQLRRKKIKMEMTYEDKSFWNFLDFVILPLFSIRKNNCQNST